MTNERASANSEATPVKEYENQRVKGSALCHKGILETHNAEVMALRTRQERYQASLPKKPHDALVDIHRTLLDTTELSEPGYAPRAALELIYALMSKNAIDDDPAILRAVQWLAFQGLGGLNELEASIQRASDIAEQFHPMREPFEA